jgi:hypothetical protein
MELNSLVYPAPEPSVPFDEIMDDPIGRNSIIFVPIQDKKLTSWKCGSFEDDMA